ncbi:glutathione S-transferase [Oricola nitratireducens]|uniref:glutathione S-transferase n=1 Tax=Oricola nitratireducens TaxID=2775868 RepID=UPI001865C169|nr:glutathione S-transferase [Oricola nitratireducens]
MTQREFPGCKLFDGGRAPNPRRVRIFLAEKGISVPLVPVDMESLGHRKPEIEMRNPMRRLPVLELEDGRILSETIAICRYFEARCPEPSLFGRDAFEQAEIEMWQRRIEFHFLYVVAQAFRHIHPAMKEWEQPQIAEWGEANKPKALEFAAFLDDELATRPFIAGEKFSVADITATIATDFCKPARIRIRDDLTNFHRWYAAMRDRPSYTA